jgi:hypothetical protein
MLRLTTFYPLLFICLLASCCTGKCSPVDNRNSHSRDILINIESPRQNEQVGLDGLIKGKVSDPKIPVYVLVHPFSTNQWWIQRNASPPRPDGSWQTTAYFGTETLGIGEEFEVVAIATDRRFFEGQQLPSFPSDVARSDIVTVRRIR